ncbi:MAG: hypothetical protein E4H10_02080 [Bacteroidia bacterium]|nr:MAG: hypothetical protein E4H10_02080 [Bacteroidia bacterium]
MKQRTLWTAILLMAFVMGTFAQEQKVTVKITDLKKVSTTLTNATTSSSSSCNTSDFPVYQGSTLKEIDFADLTWISVRHDLAASDPNNYVSVELTFKDGKTGIYEMVKHIRFTGKTSEGNFSLKVMETNTVEIVHKM